MTTDAQARSIVRTSALGPLLGGAQMREFGAVIASSTGANDPMGGTMGALISVRRVLPAAVNVLASANKASISILQSFGYMSSPGWVQFIRTDESAGVPNPPAGAAIPDVSIPIAVANQSWSINDIPLYDLAGSEDFALYIAASSTGPTYTAMGDVLWYNFVGAL